MDQLETPVADNHLHLDPERGRGMEAVDEFARFGGTHMLIVNQPSWKLGVDSTDPEDFRTVFETTLQIAAEATDHLDGRAWAILGAHPGLISRLTEDRGCSAAEAKACMQGVLDIAAEYVDDGRALGLKSGRPHYEVSEAVWAASNDVMKHAFSLGSEVDCAVQLHTEASEDLTEVAEWAEARGLAAHRVVKHYAGGRLAGPTPSVMSNKDWIETAAESGEPFLMETDFIDDPDRPGAVLGPKTVPRRVRWLADEGYDDAIRRAHVETPKRVYGIDTESTLSR